MSVPCFECDAPADHQHHVIPRSLGGTKTVPLCGACHSRAHGLAGETWRSHRALTIAGFDRRRAKGLHTGGAPKWGYSVDEDGRLIDNPHERAIVAEARRLRATGLSLRKIGAALASQGMLPRNGGNWSAGSVDRLTADAGWDARTVSRLLAD